MKKLFILGLCCTSLFLQAEETENSDIAGIGVGVEVEAGDDGYYDDDDGPYVWIGPGVYYGVWFDNEWEYNNWYHDNHHGWHGHHGDHHHGGGGGHHHGGGGDHHHGGGGHHH